MFGADLIFNVNYNIIKTIMYYLLKQSVILAIISLLAFFNIFLFKSIVLGWIILIFYLVFTSQGGFWLLVKFFVFPEKLWRLRILGAFLSLVGIGLWVIPFLLFSRLTAPAIALVLFLNGALLLGFGYWAKSSKRTPALELPEKDFYLEDGSGGPIGVVIYLVLVAISFYLLQQNSSADNITTPWSIIHSSYIYIFATSLFLLGILIFSRLQGKTILFLLVIQSFLLHSYLPLSHKLIYGADQWRHMAVERQILTEQSITPAIYDTSSFLHTLNPGQFSYLQLRGLTVILSRLLTIDLLPLNVWLLPIFWSVLLPILLFEFVFSLGWKKKESLFFVFASFLPFALQAAGSFTLPVNFGFLFWLLGLLLILKRLKEKRPGQRWVLFLYGLALGGGYILYFILFWLVWGLAALLSVKMHNIWRWLFSLVSLLFLPLIIPAIELFTKYSLISHSLNWLKQLEQLVGNFFGLYLVLGPRSHDITTGNIIFNQAPLYAFVPNFFITWRWWLAAIAIAIFCLATVGFFLMLFNKEIKYRWLAIISFGFFGSYIISRYFLAGENILTRRLDIVLAFLLMLLSFYTLRLLFERVKNWRRLTVFLAVVIVTAAICASYSLGPDTWAMSQDEYDAAQYIWHVDRGQLNHCVVGDTYPLLAVEAISGGRIVGGGFPMNEYFSQPKLIELLKKLKNDANPEAWREALDITKSEYCWLVINKKDFKANEFFNSERINSRGFGEMLVWRYQK